MINTINLPPFKKMCITIGNLPSSFMESMTYYEALCWLYDYFEKTLLPAINTNSEAITELQTAYITLKNYVDTYFDNLDIQTEINNKLDDMAESGELAEIISQYLNSTAVFGFDTIADMAASENLVNGSHARTYGQTSINDTKGAFYKIRTITTDDVIDGVNIVAITYDNTLVAEKMRDPYITILVGDSYGQDFTGISGWATHYANLYGLTFGVNAINVCVGNSGFSDPYGADNTFLNNLQSATSDIDKTKVEKIIVAGGYNDRQKTSVQLDTLISEFMTYVKANFPNAKVYVGMIANDGAIDAKRSTDINWREWIATQTLNGYKTCVKYGASYLNGVELVLHQYDLFNTFDYIHPNNNGTLEIAKAIREAENGIYNLPNLFYDGVSFNADSSYYTKAGLVNVANMSITGNRINGVFNIKTIGGITFSSYQLMNATDEYITINIGSYSAATKFFRYNNFLSEIPFICRLQFYNSTDMKYTNGKITMNLNGEIILTIYNNNIGTRYISGLSFIGSAYTLPILAQ